MTEKERFKQWLLTHPDSLNVTSYEENIMFDAWQAATQREGFKFVPVDTLDECLSWASVARWDSPSEERDIEIDYHVKIIEAVIGDIDD